MVVGKPMRANLLTAAERECLVQLNVDVNHCTSLRKVKNETVIVAAGRNLGDSGIVFKKEDKIARYGNVLKLLRSGRRAFAVVEVAKLSGDTFANYMGEPPEGLADCFGRGEYGQEFLECSLGGDGLMAIDVCRILGQCMFIPTMDDKTFVCALPRHYVHD